MSNTVNDVEKYLAQIRSISLPGSPSVGVLLYQTLRAMQTHTSNLAQQTNGDVAGRPAAPPPLAGMTVTPTSVGVHVSLAHPGEYYQGVEYHAEYADNPHFSNPFPVYMGPAREHDVAVGTKKLYWRAFPQYPTGSPGAAVYHGGAQPIAVTGGVDSPLGSSQGSGTGQPGQGLAGHGPVPYRTLTGAPPVRGNSAQ